LAVSGIVLASVEGVPMVGFAIRNTRVIGLLTDFRTEVVGILCVIPAAPISDIDLGHASIVLDI
jgi:hypothetical protein